MTLSKNRIKYIKSLQQKKFRQKYNNFVAEGDKIAREIITHNLMDIEAIYATPSWLDTNDSALKDIPEKIFNISITDLERVSGLKTANEVLVIAKQPEYTWEKAFLKSELSIYLDGIQDPGNMGTILRIADWFGIPYVFCSNDCVDIFNPKVIQSTMGAFLRVKTVRISLAELNEATELPIMGATLEGKNIYEMDLPSAGILVIGNESQGIRKASRKLLTEEIKIPAFGNSGAESLNAAVATGIICALFRA